MRRSRLTGSPLVQRGAIGLLLWLAFALMVSSMLRKSITVDEQGHLFRGIAYVKTGATHFLWGHPLFASSLNALLLLSEENLHLPLDLPVWSSNQWHPAADLFLWQLNENPHRLIFLGRLPTIWLTLLVGALVYRWGRELAGLKAALLASALWLLDPNVMAHGRLVTSDVALTLFMTLAVYGYWRYANRLPIAASLLLVGTGMGMAAATKFNAAALLPILGCCGLIVAADRKSLWPLLFLTATGVIAALVVWAAYGFAIRPWPGSAYWQEILWQLDYFRRPHGAYLLQRYSPTGWWYYFPVAFLVKTPLPTLLLFAWAIAYTVFKAGRSTAEWTRSVPAYTFSFLALPAAIYFLLSLATPLNIGYRHLLPILPFLFLFIAVTLAPAAGIALRWGRLVSIAVAALLAANLWAWPDYIPYFNWLAGGPDRQWLVLSDSNIDWGQDLPALAAWQRETGHFLYLSYFGIGHPSAYGLAFTALPTWTPGPEQQPAERQRFNAADPAPGYYAISVTNLHGLVLGNERDTFTWFRRRTPIKRIGGSIFIYEVAPRGQPTSVAFAGLRPAELDADLHAVLATNDVRVRWFDARTSLIWPAGGGWLAVASQTAEEALQPFWPVDPAAQVGTQALYLSPPFPYDFEGAVVPQAMGVLAFAGYRVLPAHPGEVSLLTFWHVLEETDRPLRIFVHALDPQEQIIGQWDRLDVDSATWQPGDVFVQLHRFAIPPGQMAQFRLGVYDAETGERLAEPVSLDE